jgi:hypothetical protein
MKINKILLERIVREEQVLQNHHHQEDQEM